MKLYEVLLLTSFAAGSLACTCLPNPPPAVALERASSVFTGQVIKAELISTEYGIEDDVDPELSKELGFEIKDGKVLRYSRLYVFLVTESYKGAKEKRISVFTEMTPEACGFEFLIGRHYLVYADGSPGNLRTSICSRTVELGTRLSAEQKKELGILREISSRVVHQ